ncbi:MAG: CoA transferase, partial [Akkermansiaceae bacterium]|nr:CoA transferase [Akkermansiaceae bacterium]
HHPLSSPYGRFEARDGFLNIAAGNERMWGKLADALGKGEWKSDPRFAGPGDRIRNRSALTAAIEDVLVRQDVSHWVAHINAAGVPCGPVMDIEQVFNDPQVLARQMKVTLPHPE